MASSRALMRLLAVAHVLLLRSDTDGHARLAVHGHHGSHPDVTAANESALLATTPVRQDLETAPPQLLASDASLHDRRARSAPAPTRDPVSLRSYERTTGQAARPPPFQA